MANPLDPMHQFQITPVIPLHIGGYDLSRQYPELGNALLVCATETRTSEDIQTYAKALAEVMG